MGQIYFDGQHSDERVLYIVRQHPFPVLMRLLKVVLAGLVILAGFSFISMQLEDTGVFLRSIGWLLALLIGVGGGATVLMGERRNIAYLTDRRVVRFQAATPWAVNSRSLSWEETVKVKTFPKNFIYRLFNIGTVVIHAKSTVVTSDEPKSKTYVSDDDVELTDVAYYRDLGNYIDKIVYFYRQKPKELDLMKPFVAKPRGKRS